MKYVFFLLIIFSSSRTYGQTAIQVTTLDKTKIPKTLKFDGKIINAVRWTDKTGENLVVTTETGIVNSTDGNRNAALYAYHYLTEKDAIKQTWKVSDFVKDCPVDLEASFVKNTFKVTDLNKDGVAEIWLMYKTACQGDVSPYEMKIIMYQGSQKFAIRGHNKVRVSEKEFAGGDYKPDKAFTDGPKVFREFAIAMWNKNMLQEWK